MIVKIATQRANTRLLEKVLEEVCGAFAGEDFRFEVIQTDDSTLEIQAYEPVTGEEIF